MSTNPNKEERAARARSLASGFRKRLSSLSVIMLDGTLPTPAEVIDTLDGFAKLHEDVEHALDVYRTLVAKANAAERAETAYVGSCARYVRATMGNDAVVLAEFGLAPIAARTPLTIAEKAAAVAKRESTREARHTLGSRERLAIHGTVTGVTITPVASPGQAATGASTPAAASPAAAEKPAPAPAAHDTTTRS